MINRRTYLEGTELRCPCGKSEGTVRKVTAHRNVSKDPVCKQPVEILLGGLVADQPPVGEKPPAAEKRQRAASTPKLTLKAGEVVDPGDPEPPAPVTVSAGIEVWSETLFLFNAARAHPNLDVRYEGTLEEFLNECAIEQCRSVGLEARLIDRRPGAVLEVA